MKKLTPVVYVEEIEPVLGFWMVPRRGPLPHASGSPSLATASYSAAAAIT